jgi:membrane protease YdiL (CAAX protease family)
MLKMDYLSGQISIANSLPSIESEHLVGNRLKRLDTSLLMETALVTVAPGILVTAALIPIMIKKSEFTKVGFSLKLTGLGVLVVCYTCIVVFPAMYCGLWLLKSYGLGLPLRPVLPQNQPWILWLLYQFMYVAVAEEVFFRGYVQSNILRLTNTVRPEQCESPQWISIVISAAVFAVAHIIAQGNVISGLTFFPGLILGWLFIRTKSILAPILFHGLANSCYLVMAAALT